MKKDNKKLITIKELSKISGVKQKKIADYVKRGLLLYEEEDPDLTRYYDKKNALKSLKEIRRLEGEGVNIKEMRIYLNKQKEATMPPPLSEEGYKIVKRAEDLLEEELRKELKDDNYNSEEARKKRIEKIMRKAERQIKEENKLQRLKSRRIN